MTTTTWPRDPACPKPRPEGRCPECGGVNGTHGLVHVRHPQGGGGYNRPCSAGAPR